MSTVRLELDDDLVAAIGEDGQPVARATLELIALELYRRGSISGGRASEVLGLTRLEFVHRAAALDIPYFRFTDDEWATEVAASQTP